jgi:hypothetical protein
MMTCLLADKLREKESGPFRTRLSNLAYYAVTGVKAQAFVRVLFYTRTCYRSYKNHINILE